MGLEAVAPRKRVDKGEERAQGQAWAPPVFKCQAEKLLAKGLRRSIQREEEDGEDVTTGRPREDGVSRKRVWQPLMPGEGEQSIPGRGNHT